MAFQGIGGAALSGQFQTTAGVTGPNDAPGMASSRFSTAIATGSDAGSAMVYQWSQQTLSQPVFCQPWREGWHKDYREGALLFNCVRTQLHGLHAPMEALASLPVLNYYLDLSVNRAHIAGGESIFENRTFLEGSTIEQFMNNFRFVGVMHNELATSEKTAYNPYSPVHQRLLNINYGGYSRVPNIFGTNVKAGDVLYLVVRDRSKYLSKFIVGPDGKNVQHGGSFERRLATLQVEGAVSSHGGDLISYDDDGTTPADMWFSKSHEKHMIPFQLDASCGHAVVMEEYDETDTFVTNTKARLGCGAECLVEPVELERLAVTDVQVLQRPYVIRIGIVKDTARNPTVGKIRAALRDTNAMDHLPRLGVLLGV